MAIISIKHHIGLLHELVPHFEISGKNEDDESLGFVHSERFFIILGSIASQVVLKLDIVGW